MKPNTIRAARNGLDWSQADLAHHAGIHRKSVARYEQFPSDPTRPPAALSKIEQAFRQHGVIVADNSVTFTQSPN